MLRLTQAIVLLVNLINPTTIHFLKLTIISLRIAPQLRLKQSIVRYLTIVLTQLPMMIIATMDENTRLARPTLPTSAVLVHSAH